MEWLFSILMGCLWAAEANVSAADWGKFCWDIIIGMMGNAAWDGAKYTWRRVRKLFIKPRVRVRGGGRGGGNSRPGKRSKPDKKPNGPKGTGSKKPVKKNGARTRVKWAA